MSLAASLQRQQDVTVNNVGVQTLSEGLKCGRWLGNVVGTNLRFIHLGFGLRGGLRLGHTVSCWQNHSLCELWVRNIKGGLKPTFFGQMWSLIVKIRLDTCFQVADVASQGFTDFVDSFGLHQSSQRCVRFIFIQCYRDLRRESRRAPIRLFQSQQVRNSSVKLTSRSSMSFSSDRFGTSTVPLYFTPVFDSPVKHYGQNKD